LNKPFKEPERVVDLSASRHDVSERGIHVRSIFGQSLPRPGLRVNRGISVVVSDSDPGLSALPIDRRGFHRTDNAANGWIAETGRVAVSDAGLSLKRF
jgi:hypothetical protein